MKAVEHQSKLFKSNGSLNHNAEQSNILIDWVTCAMLCARVKLFSLTHVLVLVHRSCVEIRLLEPSHMTKCATHEGLMSYLESQKTRLCIFIDTRGLFHL